MNGKPASAQACGEIGVLAQEAIAGMDGLGAVSLGRGEDALDVEIAFRRRRWTDMSRFIGQRTCRRRAVGVGVHGDARDAEFAESPHQAHSDLAAIGDEYLVEHARGQQKGQACRSSLPFDSNVGTRCA